MPTQPGPKKVDLNELLNRLRDPLRLRIFVTGLMLLIGYAAIYTPLSGRIEQTTRKLNEQQRRQALAHEIDRLRAQVSKFHARLPADSDTNQWVQYVLDGIRKFPLKLKTLDSESPRRIGPYQAVVLHIDLEGEFDDLDAFLRWLETDQRLFRVDTARIAPSRRGGAYRAARTSGQQNGKLAMQLTLLGVSG